MASPFVVASLMRHLYIFYLNTVSRALQYCIFYRYGLPYLYIFYFNTVSRTLQYCIFYSYYRESFRNTTENLVDNTFYCIFYQLYILELGYMGGARHSSWLQGLNL